MRRQISNPESQMFHASPKLLKSIKPQPHYLSPDKPVVFGTPNLSIALTFLQPWTDEIFELGVVGEDPPHLIERVRGAFKRVFGGKAGFIYEVSPKSFYHTLALTRFEAVSDRSPKIINIYKVDDALKALKKSDIQLVYYKDADKFRDQGYQR